MFSKPNWFRETATGLKLAPTTWQGWASMAVWSSLLAVPALALVLQGKIVEAGIWLGVCGGVVFWEVKTVREQLAGRPEGNEEDDVMVIDENETESAKFATRHYDLQFRNRRT